MKRPLATAVAFLKGIFFSVYSTLPPILTPKYILEEKFIFQNFPILILKC